MSRFARFVPADTQKQVSQGVPGVPVTGKPQKSAILEVVGSGTRPEIEVSQGVPDGDGETKSGTPGTPAVPPSAGKVSRVLVNENSELQEHGTLGAPGTPFFDNTRERVAEMENRARLGAEAYAAAPPDFEERAALIEYGAGVPRHWAEPFARLNCMPCPAAFALKQWAAIINDGGIFIDRWAEEAERLGWTAEEVFGVGRDAPDARHDLKGLLLQINGWEVIAIDAGKATVKNPKTGSTQSIYRKTDAGGRALLWELKP